MIRVGVDPGITGAVAFLDEELRCLDLFDMPTMQLGARRQQVNAPELAKAILPPCPNSAYHANLADGIESATFSTCGCCDGSGRTSEVAITVYLEQVSAMPRQGVASMFNFGCSYGVVMGICAALRYPVVLVRPAAWKKAAGLIGKPKEAARTLAQQLYPEQDLALKKHVGRADALLIARYGFVGGRLAE